MRIENPDELIAQEVHEQFAESGHLTQTFHEAIDASPKQQRILRSYAAEAGDPEFEAWVNANWSRC